MLVLVVVVEKSFRLSDHMPSFKNELIFLSIQRSIIRDGEEEQDAEWDK